MVGESGSQRPTSIHRGVTTKTTLDTAKPACLLSDHQPAAVYFLPLLSQNQIFARPTHSYLSVGLLHLGVIVRVLNAAWWSNLTGDLHP